MSKESRSGLLKLSKRKNENNFQWITKAHNKYGGDANPRKRRREGSLLKSCRECFSFWSSRSDEALIINSFVEKKPWIRRCQLFQIPSRQLERRKKSVTHPGTSRKIFTTFPRAFVPVD